MKSIYLKIMMFVLIGLAIFSCKKGENDPFLSLKSRKARFTGEWMVSSSELNVQIDGVLISSSIYNGTMETYTDYSAGSPFSYNSNYTLSYSIKKDGSYIELKEQPNSYTLQKEGNWAFIGKSSNADLKNKEAVVFSNTIQTLSIGGTTMVSSTQGWLTDEVWKIDQLKSKEIIIKIDQTESVDGEKTSYSGRIVLSKK